jgi:NAD-dependent deacetylase
LSKYKNVVVLTGAGISQESGIATFRGSDGLWEGHPVEEVATYEGFEKNPTLVYDFYNQRRKSLLSREVKPNKAHEALAEFESKFSGEYTLITQNIDNLHERAGSRNILHMHGELLKARGLKDGKTVDWREPLNKNSRHANLGLQPLRPDVVWFGEMPLYLNEITESLRKCDLFVSIGTSGLVYPAAGFVEMIDNNADSVELNIDYTVASAMFKNTYRGKAGEIVPVFFKSIL